MVLEWFNAVKIEMRNYLRIVVIFLVASCQDAPQIKNGDLVLITLKIINKSGRIIDETGYMKQAMPLLVRVGQQEVYKPIDSALVGMQLHQKKSLRLLPKDTYGQMGVFYLNKNHDTTYVVHRHDTLLARIEILKIN